MTAFFLKHPAGSIGYAVLFLIANESFYANAQTLFLDAGHIAGIAQANLHGMKGWGIALGVAMHNSSISFIAAEIPS